MRSQNVKNEVNAGYLRKNKASKIFGLILMLFAFVFFFSFLSYVFTFRMDQSIALNGWDSVKETNYFQIQNWLNKIGVYFGYLFVDELFGFAAFVLPISLFMLSLNFIFQRNFFSVLKLIFYPFLAIFILSSFFAFFQLLFFKDRFFPFGGNFGSMLTGNDSMLYQYTGLLGVFMVWAVVSLMALVWFANLNFNYFKSWFVKGKRPENEKLFHNEENDEQPEEKEFQDTIFEQENIEIPTIDVTPTVSSNLTLDINEPKPQPVVDFDFTESEPPVTNGFEVNEVVNDEEEDLELEIKETKEEKILETIPINSLSDLEPYDPKKDLPNYKYPTINLLEDYGEVKKEINREELEANKNKIINTLKNFNIEISSIKATIGPTVTLYEITPAPGVRVSTIERLDSDIALSLAALGIRIIAPIPGRGTIGIEVPNKKTEIVTMKSAIRSEKFQTAQMELPVVLGKNISNEFIVADMTKMPHLLMAGATGKGKSVGINAILMSLLYKKHPSELKFIMVDPKKVELSIYTTIENHFLAKLPNEEEPIITDVKKVVNTLNSLCIEMDDRYDLLKLAKVRNIKEYNQKFVKRQLNPNNGHKYMPYFVLVIDEYADLIITAGKEIETPLARLAQLARAIGIHIILATQRPAANVLTGLIRANFPTKIAFAVSKSIDSNIILDTKGAEQLIGKGDMLLSLSGGDLVRLQCPFVDTPEVDKVCDFIHDQQGYGHAYELPEYISEEDERDIEFDSNNLDPLLEEAAREVVMSQQGSISMLQRKLSIGHGRAGRIIDQLEGIGVVGPGRGSKPREVYITTMDELFSILNKV